MKKTILFLLICLTLISCGKAKLTTSVSSDGQGSLNVGGRISYDLYEFEYKGHAYISCEVRGGYVLTHAGHCKCNPNK